MVDVTTLPRTEGLTRADFDALPDDNRRRELIDGVIVMSAAPSPRHQGIVLILASRLRGLAPPDLRVLIAPFDVALTDQRVLEPDIVVARRSDLTERDLPVAPVLAVEVLSPSTRWLDLGRKAEILAESGCPSYWTIDPGTPRTPPVLTVHRLDEGRYVETAVVTGAETWRAELPFPVDLVPNELIDD